VTPTAGDDDRIEAPGTPSVRELFDELVELPPERRAERLAAIAASSPAVAQAVAELLAADEAAPTTLGVPKGSTEAFLAVAGTTAVGPERGAQVGPYRLLVRIGEGGMGEVWRAERIDGQFERTVALKLVKRGMDSDEIRERFLFERQILARLDHPGIARLLDGGIAAGGRPWFALELVDGETITAFAAARGLEVEARVRLVVEACDAVAAAHARLVVHRDIKPSNVLVDGSGRVRLLDFGIAKLVVAEGEQERTRVVLPMTPAYAAPEQVRGEPVTTATDVYALGAVLYELLTGELPFPRRGSTAAALADEVAREILVRPSRRVGGGAEGAKRARLLAGDLDTIVAKALHGEPARRYPSVEALADDLRRFLQRRPVLARSDSWRYRLGKLVRRNRVASAAAALGFVALVAGLAAALWQARVARASAARAAAEATHARRVQELLVGLFQGADPTRTLGATLTARQILDEGARRLPRELADDPETRAAIFDVFARTYRSLGLLDDARRYAAQELTLRRTLDGPASVPTAEAELTTAEVALDRGTGTATRPLLTSLVETFDRTLGPTSPQALRARTALAQARDLAGDDEGARRLLQQVVDADTYLHGEDSAETIDGMASLADVVGDASRFDEAERILRDAHARLERSGGLDSPQAVRIETTLAELLATTSRHEEAEQRFREVLAKSRRVLGPRQVATAEILIKYGFLLSNVGRIPESDERLAEAAGILEPLGHFDYGAAIRYLGYNALAEERFADARRRFDEAERFFRATLGDDTPMTWAAVVSKAAAEMRTGELAAAEHDQRAAIAAIGRLQGTESDDVRTPLVALGETLRLEGRYVEAIAVHERTLAMAIRSFGAAETLASAASRLQLAEDHLRAGSTADLLRARSEVDAGVAYLRSHSEGSARLGRALVVSARIARATGDRTRSRRELAEAVELLRSNLPPRAPSLAEARALLAKI